ncbi:FBP domain-containing protein [Rhodococcus sp. NPDC058521]|uniref:FBP domain-containing protein n=1 Tax=Rhodococcus sp. NPDC058521 TaxID=3346536 RepID=UPI003658EFEB
MDPITEREIRSSFVNCSKGDAKRLPTPTNLDERPWDDLDFLGWSDPSFPGRTYLVVPHEDRLVGVAMRHEIGGRRKSQMCTICLTTHPSGGVSLMVARKTGDSGRRGNTVGTYMCEDLACPLYARRKKTPALGRQFRDDTPLEDRVEKVRTNIDAFISRLYS